MKISFFDTARDNEPRLRDLSWDELKALLSKHTLSKKDKLSSPAISPTEFEPGATRSKEAVKQLHFGVIDLDGVSAEELEETLTLAQPYTQIYYTTWSHAGAYEKDGVYSARLFLALSRPVLAHEWKSFWLRLNAHLGGHADPSSVDASRMYFLPFVPTLDHAETASSDGIPVDVDALLKTHLEEAPLPVAPENLQKTLVTKDDLTHLAQRLTRRKNDHSQNLGHRLSKALKGEVFAVVGERDDVCFRLGCQIAESFPFGKWDGFPEIFKTAFDNLGSDAPTVQNFVEKITRRQVELAQEKQRDKEEQDQEKALRIKAAFRSERYTPYTKEEVEGFAKQQNCSVEEFKKRWVIQVGGSFYFYVAGNYVGPFAEGCVPNAALQYLAPAISVGVDIHYYTEKGKRCLKTQGTILEEYGRIAVSVAADLTAQHSYYSEVENIFYEASCPLRSIPPERDQAVEKWLEQLAGPFVHKLNDWIATVTDLKHPTSALYLNGAPGTGKTLLAMGLARLWTTGEPTALYHAMANFNADIARCPLILADEVLPEGMRKDGTTGELRQFIQATNRSLSRKFMPNATLLGAIRAVIAANNMGLFETSENLSVNDRLAIGERILYIPVQDQAKEFLQNCATLSTFVSGDRIARHAMWLKENRVVQRGKRFLVEGQDSDLHRHMVVSTGVTSAVCHWLVLFLQEKQKMLLGKQDRPVRIWQGKLHVRAKALTSQWSVYPTNTRDPTAAQVSKALANISERKKQLRDRGKQTEYWVIKTDPLITWATNTGFASKEEIEEALSVDTPISDEDAQLLKFAKE